MTNEKVPIVPGLSARDINHKALNELNKINPSYLKKAQPIDIMKIVEIH